MRDLLVRSLEGAKLFVLTDNQERADAILRGGAEDLVFTDVHSSSEGINARANIGTGRGARTSSSQSVYGGVWVGAKESSHVPGRKRQGVGAVRVGNKDGEAIWSTPRERQGADIPRPSTP